MEEQEQNLDKKFKEIVKKEMEYLMEHLKLATKYKHPFIEVVPRSQMDKAVRKVLKEKGLSEKKIEAYIKGKSWQYKDQS